MDERFHIRGYHAPLEEEAREHARHEAVRERETGRLNRAGGLGTAHGAGLLECEERVRGRHPQRAREPKEGVRLLIVLEHRGDPGPLLEGTGDLRAGFGHALARLRMGVVALGGQLQGRRLRRRRARLVADQREEAPPHGVDTVLAQRLDHRVGSVSREVGLVEIDLHGRVREDRGHLAREQRVVDVRTQVLAHLALDLVGVRDDLVQAAVLVDERAGLLGTDARHAGDVVGAVALETVEVRHERRGDAMVEVFHALGRHDLNIGEALLGAHDLHVLGGKLVHVAVAGDEQHVAAGFLARAGHGTEDVVTLPALCLEDGDGELLEQLLHHGKLLVQVRVHGRTLGLVLGQHVHAHLGLALIERADHGVGMEGVDHLQEHVEEAEDGVRGASVRRVHGGRHGVERAVHERVAVDDGDDLAIGHESSRLVDCWRPV